MSEPGRIISVHASSLCSRDQDPSLVSVGRAEHYWQKNKAQRKAALREMQDVSKI